MRIIKVTSLIRRSLGEDFLLSVVFKKRYGWYYETVGGTSTPCGGDNDAVVTENGSFSN